jgi:anti-sigma B factor antagonist
VQPLSGIATLVITGEVDMATSSQFHEDAIACLTANCTTLRLDLRGVTFMDARGIGGLVEIRNAAIKSGHKLIVASPPQAVRRVLDITAMTQVFTVEEC